MVSDAISCRNCSDVITGNFCANCGQPVKLKRVDSHYVSHEIQHLLHFEKGFLYTIKELLVRPGKNVKEFIADNRSRLVKPIIFLIITSLIYTTVAHFFHVEDQYIGYHGDKVDTTTKIMAWVQGHYGYGNIIMGVFIAFWVKLFFRKYDYNFFEILILLCFTMGMGMLILALFTTVQSLINVKLMTIAAVILMIYLSWAIGQFFGQKKVFNYVKAFIAYLLGMISFMLVIMLIGFIVDALWKH